MKEQSKGRVTIPTDVDVVPETLELLERWGADAIRDCDGTDYPEELKSVDAKVYSTYYTTRKDNAWAKANPDEIQQMYIMTPFYTATEDELSVHLMNHLYPDMLKVNNHDDITRWWEVIDRTTGDVVPVSEWSYDEETGDDSGYTYQPSPVIKSPRPLTRPSRPDIKHVARMLSTDSELAALMEEAQMILGKTLSSGDAATLLMLRDTYGVPAEVLIMIIQYCASVDKGNMHAVEKEAINWSDEGIVTMEQADEKIKDLTERREAWNRVSRVFGFKNVGSPTKKQLEFASRWTAEWKFSDEMLREAYERCVDAKGIYEMNYINGILSNWYKNKIFNMDELRSADAARMMSDKGDKKISDTAQSIHNKKHSYNIERTYDIGELEKRSILDEQD